MAKVNHEKLSKISNGELEHDCALQSSSILNLVKILI